MARLRVWTAAATFCIASIPLIFPACGLGSDMDVGDDRSTQTSTGGSATGGSSASGGLLGNGGFIGPGASTSTGSVQITIAEGGMGTGGSPGGGGARATGGATGTGGQLPEGEPCRENVCGLGEFCCNPSCGVCAPKGGACDMKACEPVPGAPCGPRVCGAGLFCCNESCGVCAPLNGGTCTQEFCEPPSPCQGDGDCRVESDYCAGCNCRPLAPNEKLPACAGPEAQCLIDPCDGKSAVCRGGRCVVQ